MTDELDRAIPGGRRLDEPEEPAASKIIDSRTGMHVFTRDGKVIVTFDPPPDYLELPPGDAMRLGRELVARAQRAMRNTGGRIPRS